MKLFVCPYMEDKLIKGYFIISDTDACVGKIILNPLFDKDFQDEVKKEIEKLFNIENK